MLISLSLLTFFGYVQKVCLDIVIECNIDDRHSACGRELSGISGEFYLVLYTLVHGCCP